MIEIYLQQKFISEIWQNILFSNEQSTFLAKLYFIIFSLYFKKHKITTFMIQKHVKHTSLMKNTNNLAKMFFVAKI